MSRVMPLLVPGIAYEYDSGYESDSEEYECCVCNSLGYFNNLQEAYDNGWFEFDYAHYCSDHASDAIDVCDNWYNRGKCRE